MGETYKVLHGGLMRCCLESLVDAMIARQQANRALMTEGDCIKCRYCLNEMICVDGAWRWAGPPLAESRIGD
jgi:hypothetical protein